MKPVDIFLLYQFVKRLSTPFEHWKMYQNGIIDEHGNFLEPKEKRSPDQLASYSYFDILILNLKKLLAKLPGGSTRIATLAAALYLLREPKPISESAIYLYCEDFEREMSSLIEEIKTLFEDEGGVPVNNMSAGNIADHNNRELFHRKLTRKKKQEVQPAKLI